MKVNILNKAAFAKKPAVVVFNLDNTICGHEEAHAAATKAAITKACDLLCVTPKAFVTALDEARWEIEDMVGPTVNARNCLLHFQRCIEKLSMKTHASYTLLLEQTYWRNYLLASALLPGVKDFILDVRSFGGVTAAISDSPAKTAFRKIIYWGVDSMLDHVVTCEEAGSDKLSLIPFEVLRAKLGKIGDDGVWMIGDQSSDLNAKECLGATTLFFGKPEKQDLPRVDATFNDFAALSKYWGEYAPALRSGKS